MLETRKNVMCVSMAPINQKQVQQPVCIAYQGNTRQKKTKQIVLYVLLGEPHRKKKQIRNVQRVSQAGINQKKVRQIA
jgi:methyl coenzyme M reductase subunit C